MIYNQPQIYSDNLAEMLIQFNHLQRAINSQCAYLMGIKSTESFRCSYNMLTNTLNVDEGSLHLKFNDIIQRYEQLHRDDINNET